MQRKGKDAVIVQHLAGLGKLRTRVQKFKVGNPKQYDTGVDVSFVKPRARDWRSFTIVPDNRRFLRDGVEIYDSRADVPCDMSRWWDRPHRALLPDKWVSCNSRNAPD